MGSSQPLLHEAADQEADLDPFLRAYSPEASLNVGVARESGGKVPLLGYDVGEISDVDSRGMGSMVGASAVSSANAGRRQAKDEEEGLGLAGLFPGSDLF